MLISIIMTELSQRLNDTDQESHALELRQHHITAWRYRVYMFVIFVAIVFIEPMFTASVESLRGKEAFALSLSDPIGMFTKVGSGGKINELNEMQAKIDQTVQEIETTKLQIEIVQNLEKPEKRAIILNCVNKGACEGIPAGLMDRFDLLRSFLAIDHLVTDKLDFDQKFVLRNINEFLATQVWRGQLVTIKNITFTDPVEIKPEYKLMKVWVNLIVEYMVNNDFMVFLNNLETKISPELPVMWRIEAVNYDIVNYLDAQKINLSLAFYYINTPKTDLLVKDDSTHASATWDVATWDVAEKLE